MIPSPWLYSFLQNYERYRPTAYLPTARDVWTIGWGHTDGVKEGDTCTWSQAQAWLMSDAAWASAAVSELVKASLNQNQFDALCSLCFNIGRPQFAGSTLLKLLNAAPPNYTGAARQFPVWDRQADVVVDGLLTRRQAEQARFNLAVT